jgi:outer membrane cobalamin receptor
VRGTDLSADIAGSGEAASYAAGIARHETNGLYALNNGHHNNVLSGRFQFTPRAGTELRLALRYTDFRFNYPTNGGGTVGDVNANRTEDRTIVGVEVERRLTPTARGVLALNSSVNDGVTDDAMDAPTGSSTLIQDKTRRRGAELRAQWTPLSSAAATVGVQMEQQDHRQALQSESSFGPFMSSFRAARRNTGLYGEAVLTPVTALTATLGVRLDDNEAFGQFVTHRVGASWRPVATTRVRATLGNAFREPTFLENFSSGFATGNPGLEAERTSSWDAGVDQELFDGRVSASATYFAQRFTNMIDYDPADSCGFSYCNVAEATSKGTEIELRARVSAVWASVGATILKTEVLEPGFDQTSGGLYRRGESLIRRPERKITGELAYRGSAPLSASLRVQAVGKRTDRDFRPFPSTPVTLEGYERFDAGAEYALPYMGASRTALTLRVENLTDVTYENVFNFLSPRRTIVVGVRSAF